MHRRRPPILISVLALSLVALVGRPLEAKTTKPRDVIEVRILEFEHDAKKPSRERTLIVPISGKVAGLADLFDEPGECRLRSSPVRDDVVTLDLRCATRAGNHTTLQLAVERAFVLDETTLVGVVDTQQERRIEVVATRR